MSAPLRERENGERLVPEYEKDAYRDGEERSPRKHGQGLQPPVARHDERDEPGQGGWDSVNALLSTGPSGCIVNAGLSEVEAQRASREVGMRGGERAMTATATARRPRLKEGAYLILGTSSGLSLPFPSFCPILQTAVVVETAEKKNARSARSGDD